MSSTTAPAFKPFNLALIQLGQVGVDKAANLKHAREMISKAVSGDGGNKPKPDLVVLPECFNSLYGHTYFPETSENIAYTPGQLYDVDKSESQQVLITIPPRPLPMRVLGSIPEREQSTGKLYNTATVYSPKGELVAMHRKVHLFDIDIPGKITFKESENLSPGETINHLDTEFARIGLGICYDVRFPELAMTCARRGCHMMIYPSAFNTTTGPMHWELLQRARAVDNQVFFSMCSPARDMTQSYHAWGHSMVVDPMGRVLEEAGHEEDILYVHIDPKTFEDARAAIPVTTQRRFGVYPDVAGES
ncbi:carbon-nitrogen hydrolase [Epithele typhae]|uniref:carbon-nitrogen hydrolase n=1 Tax=Epithele typhae TaxID=378194 RepID=UPI002007F63C|nr:carbon-nitrogen hydrolase [Epithele typhae]KAH9946411.1 carbon-nitrogen hydrolase [Epithele typhae]